MSRSDLEGKQPGVQCEQDSDGQDQEDDREQHGDLFPATLFHESLPSYFADVARLVVQGLSQWRSAFDGGNKGLTQS